MKAMILAAGRGERLRPLTDTTPKPLVQVGDYSLIEWHIKRLYQAGVHEIVINVSHLAEKIKNKLGDGRSYNVNIQYSEELPPALETGGGIMQALPLLGDHAFILINGDIWTDYPLESLVEPQGLAHLVMVNNPPQHPDGDFVLHDGLVQDQPEGNKVTYSGIGVYRPDLFSGCTPGRFPLTPVLKRAMLRKLVSGELYSGSWHDIGTLDRLQHVRDILAKVD